MEYLLRSSGGGFSHHSPSFPRLYVRHGCFEISVISLKVNIYEHIFKECSGVLELMSLCIITMFLKLKQHPGQTKPWNVPNQKGMASFVLVPIPS